MLDIHKRTASCNHNEENQKLLFSFSNGSVVPVTVWSGCILNTWHDVALYQQSQIIVIALLYDRSKVWPLNH